MMEINVDMLFASLESQAENLNKLSDDANRKIAAIEKRLINLNIGIEYWYARPIAKDDAQGTFSPNATSEQLVQLLGFSRVESKWCLALKPILKVNGFYEGDTSAPFENLYSGGKVIPLLQASRELRIASLAAMPHFLKDLNEHIQNASELIQKAVG